MQAVCGHCAKNIDSSQLHLYTSKFRSFYMCKECLAWFKIGDDNYKMYVDWEQNIEKTT